MEMASPEKYYFGLHPGDPGRIGFWPENLRFHPDEENGSADFAKSLAGLGDVFVNDAFSASHRAHASIVGIGQYLPAVAGLLLEKEIDTLGGLLKNPAHPSRIERNAFPATVPSKLK